MRTLLAVLALTLASCASTPADVREQGTRVDASHGMKPQVLARCMQRAVEKQSGLLIVDVRPFGIDGAEVIVRVNGTYIGTIAVIELTPSRYLTNGTSVVAWISPYEPNEPGSVLRGFLIDC